MYSRILTKLISEALTPFIGFMFIKIVVTILTAKSLGIGVSLTNVFYLNVSLKEYLIINSNILFGFIVFSFLGLSYSLIKSIYFHNSHINPRLSLSVFNLRVGFLIQDSFHLFSQNLIWLIFNYISLFITLFLMFLGLTEVYLILISCLFTLIGTYFFILDIEYEIQKNLSREEDQEIFV